MLVAGARGEIVERSTTTGGPSPWLWNVAEVMATVVSSTGTTAPDRSRPGPRPAHRDRLAPPPTAEPPRRPVRRAVCPTLPTRGRARRWPPRSRPLSPVGFPRRGGLGGDDSPSRSDAVAVSPSRTARRAGPPRPARLYPGSIDADARRRSTAGDPAPGQRPVLVRERPEVQALPQAQPRAACCPAWSSRRCAPVPPTHRAAALRRHRRACPPGRAAASRPPDVIERMRGAGRLAAEILRARRRGGAARHHHRRARRLRARAAHRARRLPEPAQLPRLPQEPVHLGQRGHLPRHPRQPARCRTATSSTSTSPSSPTACTATPTPRSSSATSTRPVRQLVRVTEECHVARHRRGAPGPPAQRHRPGHRGPRQAAPATAWCGRSSATASASSSTPTSQVPHYYDPRATTDHAPGHDVHDRADDHPRRRGSTRCGTTTGPRSPPTASARPSSSTRRSSPTTACDVLTGGDGAVSPTAPWNR